MEQNSTKIRFSFTFPFVLVSTKNLAEHWAWMVLVEVRQGTLAWMVVVEVRQGTLGAGIRGAGPARNTGDG